MMVKPAFARALAGIVEPPRPPVPYRFPFALFFLCPVSLAPATTVDYLGKVARSFCYDVRLSAACLLAYWVAPPTLYLFDFYASPVCFIPRAWRMCFVSVVSLGD